MIGLRIIDGVAQQRWLDQASDKAQQALQGLFDSGGDAGRAIEEEAARHRPRPPDHPAITDIPTGAWTVAAVLDALDALGGRLDLAPGADAAIQIGLVGALGAAATGMADWKDLDAKPRRIGLLHGLLNLGATGLYAASLLARGRGQRAAGRRLAFTGYALAIGAAYLGGDLVYREQIGVSHAEPVWTALKFTPVLAERRARRGRSAACRGQGRARLCWRCCGQVYALAESCSHLGGPLSDGQIEGGAR